MKRIAVLAALMAVLPLGAQTRLLTGDDLSVAFTDGVDTLRAPAEGLWSIATSWTDDWPSGWVHVKAQEKETSGEWTILKAEVELPQGKILLRDAYAPTADGMIHCTGEVNCRCSALQVQ